MQFTYKHQKFTIKTPRHHHNESTITIEDGLASEPALPWGEMFSGEMFSGERFSIVASIDGFAQKFHFDAGRATKAARLPRPELRDADENGPEDDPPAVQILAA
jgi:hypothetical protein